MFGRLTLVFPDQLSAQHFTKDLIYGFPIGVNISNIENIQVDKPAVAFYGSGSIPVMGIESGSHEAIQSFRRAICCVKAVLKNTGLIEGKSVAKQTVFKEYRIEWSMRFPDSSWKLVKALKAYEPVRCGQVLATDGEHQILAPFDGHALFCSATLKPVKLADEVVFFLRPVRIIRL